MAQESTNPFVLPGFGQQGEAARNPLFAGLDMMRQAWQNMAGAGGLDAAQLTPMSLEDLERRIRELQTVQNWLQLNATMLANTIQGLEIQRGTIATMAAFSQAFGRTGNAMADLAQRARDAARRFQGGGLGRIAQPHAVCPAVAQRGLDALAQPGVVHQDVGDAGPREAFQVPGDQGAAAHGQQGLGAGVRQRTHALAAPRGQDHGAHQKEYPSACGTRSAWSSRRSRGRKTP